MVKKLFLLSVLAIAVGTYFSSCKKSSSKSRTEYLTQASWKLNKQGLDENINNQLDASEQETIDACEADDSYSLHTGGTGVYSTGTNHCTTGEPESASITWSLSSDGSQITIDAGFGASTSTIVSINDNELIVTSPDVTSGGTATKYFTYLKH